MLLYFSRVPFMLVHCLIDDICLPVFENIYILIILFYFVYLFKYLFFIFLNSFLVFFRRTTCETSVLLCALMYLSSVNIIYMLLSLFAYASNTNFYLHVL